MRPAAAFPASAFLASALRATAFLAAGAAAGPPCLLVVRVLAAARFPARGDGPPVLPAGFGRGSAPRAGEGAVEVPAARVAVVHEAWRLGGRPSAAEAAAVKVVCGINNSGRGGVVSGRRHDRWHDAELLRRAARPRP
ncbi:hypothetical protein CP975_10820 [Streptomyces alboniger]|uniref:Uncharacterized protein n=1 Tax=Streptomyces alboniger TaxID=132473 RepID=A0A5J6HCK8_STRAD|nr:hypothetical protein CP975_10820 [Streptomyces alboniger]